MSFEDFVRNFEKLEICHLGPEVLEEIYQMTGVKSSVRQNWSTKVHHGAWRRHQNAGGCRNYLRKL
jgi:calpain, invertebrate